MYQKGSCIEQDYSSIICCLINFGEGNHLVGIRAIRVNGTNLAPDVKDISTCNVSTSNIIKCSLINLCVSNHVISNCLCHFSISIINFSLPNLCLINHLDLHSMHMIEIKI